MIIETDIDNKEAKDKFTKTFRRSIQSANINFIFGSGCSSPSIPALGDIEKQIKQALDNGKNKEAINLLYDFLLPFVNFMTNINSKRYDMNFSSSLKKYIEFISNITKILFQRKSNILHKQVSVFTTNYDLFFELAYQNHSENLILHDGFKKNPVINDDICFSISEYFNTVYNIGSVYNYQVEIPSINLIKLHGSLNWQIRNEHIINSIDYFDKSINLAKSKNINDMENFINSFSIVLPKKDKFKETILNQVYYDLLRIFANELDKENTLLISEGFSFSDEHILEIIKRSLRNPTLKLIIFCFSVNELNEFRKKFDMYNNVEIVYSSKENISFDVFSNLFLDVLPLHLHDVEKGE